MKFAGKGNSGGIDLSLEEKAQMIRHNHDEWLDSFTQSLSLTEDSTEFFSSL